MKQIVRLSVTVLLSACGAGSLPTSRTDNTPPTVKPAIELPEVTAADPFVLPVTAEDDLAGVVKVVARVKAADAATATMVEGRLLKAEATTPGPDAAPGVPLKGTWSLPLHFTPGINHVEVWAVDMAGNSGEGQQNHEFAFDVTSGATPPTVACAATPEWVSTSSIDLAITATDTGSGVAGVFCQATAVPIVATASEATPGLWTCTMPLHPGANAIKIWAKDANSRSGASMAPPYSLTVVVNQASSIPTITQGYYASYRPEGAATLSGPASPPALDYHAEAVSIRANDNVVKLVPTLTWGPSAPTADTLEAGSTNTPFLSFEVTSSAPVASARFHLIVKGTNGQVHQPPEGDLLASKRSGGGKLIYLLPLARETLFAAYSRNDSSFADSGPFDIAATATITDSAGQTASIDVPLHLELVGVPLWIAEDTGYPAARDPMSTFAYQLYDGTYEGIRNGAGNDALGVAQDGVKVMRLVRFVVTNPFTEAVALAMHTDAGSWSFRSAVSRFIKQWPDNARIGNKGVPAAIVLGLVTEPTHCGNHGYPTPCPYNGNMLDCCEDHSSQSCPDARDPDSYAVPVSAGGNGDVDGGFDFCAVTSGIEGEVTLPESVRSGAEDLRLLGYLHPSATGQETELAQLRGDSAVVPAQSSVVVYLVRTVRAPVSLAMAWGLPRKAHDLTYGSLDPTDPGAKFYGLDYATYWKIVPGTFVRGGCCGLRNFAATHRAERHYYRVISARDYLDVRITLSTGGGSVTPKLDRINNLEYNRAINH